VTTPVSKPTSSARRFRSQDWFDNPDHIDMTALYLERFMNYGITADELRSGKPIIGIAQSGSDLSPCNRIHLELAKRVRDGIRDAGGIPMEFPLHPIFENCRRPTAAIDRNLAYMGLVEILHGYPIDAIVLTTGCDKTTPAQLMAASTVDIPAIVLSGGPMLDGWLDGELVGSGAAIWKGRRQLAAGQIDNEKFLQIATASAPSAGHCNTMGTASTMNAIAEALGMSLTGCSAIPAPYRERGQIAYETGRRIVALAFADVKPSAILTREAFLDAIVVNAAIGGSTNAQPHIMAMARHAGVELTSDDWMEHGYEVPLLLNMQPAGKYLGERFHRAGGVPAIMWELQQAGLLRADRLTVTGKTMAENLVGRESVDREMITPFAAPLRERSGFLVLKGNLFDFAIMKTSVISDAFRQRYLSTPGSEGQFDCRAVVFDGSSDYHARQRPGARYRRRLDPRHPRLRPDRLARFGRSRQHATARRADQTWYRRLAHAGRRAPVGHVGQPVDPQRVARERGRRWPGLHSHRRHRAREPEHGPLRHARRRGHAGAAQARTAAADPGEPDAVAGDLPRHGRPAGNGGLHGTGRALPENRRGAAAA
jgi:dihydroxyacid dehydratase/phosphogluconate dehydratase